MSNVLDGKVTIGMFVNSLADKFQGLMASTMSTEDKLRQITEEKGRETQELRIQVRQIGAQMRALSDPETTELEPLEALKARRAKLVKLGGQNIGNQEKLGQIQQEIQALDRQIAGDQKTYDLLKGSYDIAKANYTTALRDYETLKSQGPAIIRSMAAYEQAMKMRDSMQTADTTSVTNIMDELTSELETKQAELRTDSEIENDIDATKPGSLDAELAAMDAETVDADLMAEFEAAAQQADGPKKRSKAA